MAEDKFDRRQTSSTAFLENKDNPVPLRLVGPYGRFLTGNVLTFGWAVSTKITQAQGIRPSDKIGAIIIMAILISAASL